MATNSDRVREYVFNNYVLPARQRGQKHVDVVAGEVANAMFGFQNRRSKTL